jgi:Glycosyl hydrolase catalytic core
MGPRKSWALSIVLVLVATAALGCDSSHRHVATRPVHSGERYPQKSVVFECANYPYSSTDIDTVAADLHAAGAVWARVFVSWEYLNWAQLDTCADSILDHGMSVDLVSYQTSSSAQSGYASPAIDKPPSDCVYPTYSPCTALGTFEKRLASHFLRRTTPGDNVYGARNFALEIWNEPNDRHYLLAVCDARGDTWVAYNRAAERWESTGLCPGSTSNEQAAAAKEYYHEEVNAYTMVKQVDRGITVALAGIATSGGYFSGPAWLRRMYSLAPPTSRPWDAVSVHAYPPYGSGPEPRCPPVPETFRPVADVDSVLAAYNDDSKPLWLTEFAWSTARGSCTATEQSDRISAAFTYFNRKHLSNVKQMYWFLSDRKQPGERCAKPYLCYSGLLDTTLSTKTAAYAAFSAAP